VVSPEAKAKAAEAKARGQDAFHRKDFQMAIDAYTQVFYSKTSSEIKTRFLIFAYM
jgi:hypothetical protein